MKTAIYSFRILFFVSLFFSENIHGQLLKHTVYFSVDKYSIEKKEETQLSAFFDGIEKSRIEKIEIYGHTDSDANEEYNKVLSENRVKSVLSFLELKNIGIVPESNFHGEKQPLNENLNDQEKQLNRRVEIFIHLKPEVIEVEDGDIRDLYKLLEQQKQQFCINPLRDTVLLLDQGTIIKVPANSFTAPIGTCVKIKAKEFYKKSDMILENLSTTSDGKMLETGGMIFIEAFADTSELKLNKGKELLVLMPTDSVRDMSVFKGQRNSHDDLMNWIYNPDIRIAGIDPRMLSDCYNRNIPSRDPCPRCTFFFCRIKRFGEPFKGISDNEIKKANKQLRECQRNYRKNKRSVAPSTLPQDKSCAALDSLFKTYGVENYTDLLLAMNKKIMDSLGVKTLVELRDTLEKIRIQKTIDNINSGGASMNEINYYMFPANTLGWYNLDRYNKMQGKRIVMTTDLPVKRSTDAKLVFKQIQTILPANPSTEKFKFDNVLIGHNIILVALKYEGGRIFLSLSNTKTKEIADKIIFKEVTAEELKKELLLLN